MSSFRAERVRRGRARSAHPEGGRAEPWSAQLRGVAFGEREVEPVGLGHYDIAAQAEAAARL